MKTQTNIVYRVGAAKALGLLIGVAGFVTLPYFFDQSSMHLRIGVLFWYPTLGAFIGMAGIFTKHPVLNIPLPWLVRGVLVGAWMNLLLVLVAFDQFNAISEMWRHSYGISFSPYWLVLEGAVLGALIDFFITRWYGEGLPATIHQAELNGDLHAGSHTETGV